MIHAALYASRARFWTQQQLDAELEAMIEEGIRSADRGESVEVTLGFWKDLERRARRHAKKIQQLQAEGTIGNLELPRELYEFVKERMASGECKTPTAVVCERYCQ